MHTGAEGPLITKAGLRERGWRPAMVRDLLGEPDCSKPNPHHRSGPPMALYARTRVEAAETMPAFRERLARAEAAHRARSAASRAVAVTKREAAAEWARTIAIGADWPKNERAAIREGVANWHGRQAERGRFDADGYGADDATKRRWAVNHLRHRCTSYEAELSRLFGVVGRDEAYAILRKRVDAMIRERFPGLAAD